MTILLFDNVRLGSNAMFDIRTFGVYTQSARRFIIIWLLAVMATLTSTAAAPLPRAALILDESDPSGGAPTTFSATLRATLNNSRPRVAVFGETLDLSRFAGPKQEGILRTYIEQKYSDVRVGIIVAVGASAFDLVRRWRSELWPDLPVVFAAIDEITAAKLQLGSNTTGLIMRRTIKSMMTTARILVPDLQGVTLLGGSLERDAYRRLYLHELPALAAETTLTNLTGLPKTVQEMRAAALPSKTAILYTSLFIDDEGTRYSARDALAAIASVANRPIVVDVESRIGLGATGGFVLDNVAYGQEVAALVLRILDGASVAANPVAISEFTRPIFDWRQLQRWRISESTLPPGSEIRFREPAMWQQIWELYRIRILAVIAGVLAQAALIGWLLYERGRRRLAEAATRQTMSDLLHVSRVATASALAASIAHEVSQPLAGIVSYANAGIRWLGRATPDISRADATFRQIVDAGHHASEVITSVRALFKRSADERVDVNINRLIRNATSFERRDIEKQEVSLRLELNEWLPDILGVRVQLLQVMLNLLRNAIEAMESARERTLRIKSDLDNSGDILVSVQDSGAGIDQQNLDHIFDPLFTTKPEGLGIGLSICRSIIESHGGCLWAISMVGHGSTFFIQLPSLTVSDMCTPSWGRRSASARGRAMARCPHQLQPQQRKYIDQFGDQSAPRSRRKESTSLMRGRLQQAAHRNQAAAIFLTPILLD
jgi:signal transduction histidine kinase